MPGDQRDYRIRPVRRGVYRIWFLLAGLLLALAFYGSYRLGGYHLGLNYGELLAHSKRQGAELTELNADRDRLVKEVATFQLRHELEKTAREAAVAELGAQRERVNALRKELELYAGLVNRKVRSDELLIHRAVVEKVAGEGQYRYELLLAQPLKVNGMVEGMATVALVVGDENHAVGEQPFSFEVFQRISGSLEILPDWPESTMRLVVQLAVKGREVKSASFDWHRLLTEEKAQ